MVGVVDNTAPTSVGAMSLAGVDYVTAVAPGALGAPHWSADDSVIVWLEQRSSGAVARRLEVTTGEVDEVVLPRGATQILAVAPAGDVLLVAVEATEATATEATATEATAAPATAAAILGRRRGATLTAVRISDGAVVPLGWWPAGAPFRASWLP
jgi:hypothetical protein